MAARNNRFISALSETLLARCCDACAVHAGTKGSMRASVSEWGGAVSRFSLQLVTVWLLACQPRATQQSSEPDASAPTAGGVQAPLALGDTAALPMLRVRFVSQRDCGKSTSGAARSPMRSWAGELEITNTSSRRFPANPFYATLKDDQGFDYTTNLAECGTTLPSRILEPAESVRGFVPFELPATLDSVTLTYKPALGDQKSSDAAQFRVEL